MMKETRLAREIVLSVLPLLLAGLLACQLSGVRITPPVFLITPTYALELPVDEAAAAPAQAVTSATSHKTIMQSPPAQPSPTHGIIVDNSDPGFSIKAGEWGACLGGECSGAPYGADFRYAEVGCTMCQAQFDLKVPAAGDYEVWAWWPWGEDRSTDTPFTLMYGSSPVKLNVDQRNSGDGWFWLDQHAFQAGESLSIVIGGAATGFANADAVAITLTGSGPPSGPAGAAAQATSEPAAEGIEPTAEEVEPTEGPPAEPQVAPTEEPLVPRGSPSAAGAFQRVIFLHHSTGANLIAQGGVRERLTALGYEFDDHGYNEEGLTLADGTSSGRNFGVPDDNTDPNGYAAVFAQPLHDPPDNTFSHLMQYDVIAFKSCFPVSNIEIDEQLGEYKSYYLSIRNRLDQYPNKMFVIATQPPQVPAETSPEAAARARAFTNWLASQEYLSGHPNIFTFNFFDLLADRSNTLRKEYRGDEHDAHPNERANQTIAPLFVDFIHQAVQTYSRR